MNFIDKNQTLEPPEGALALTAWGEGAYLRLVYHKPISGGIRVTTIFLQDSGREVLRTVDDVMESPVADPIPAPVGKWFRVKNGFLLALLGIEEMLRCLR